MSTKNKKERNSFQLGELSPKQKDFLYSSDAFINICHGAVRSGKTMATNLRFLAFLAQVDGDEFLLTGRTRDTIERNVIRDLIKMIDGRVPYKYKKIDGILEIDGKTIFVIGLSDESATEKLRGLTCNGWYGDEITSAPKSAVEMAITRCSMDNSKIFWTCNPQSPYHYIYTDYITNQELLESGTVKEWHFSLDDNYHLSEEYKEELKRVNKRSEANYRRNILGQWVIAEGIIYDAFDLDKHIFTKPPRIDEYAIGSDYGVSSVNVFSLVGIHKDPNGNSYYILDEVYHDAIKTNIVQTDAERVADLIKLQNKYHLNKKTTLFLSHDASSLNAECRKNKGVKVKVRTYKPDTIGDINTIQDLFANDRLFIHKDCKNMIRSVSNYSWDLKAAAKGKDSPLKVDDHSADSLRGAIIGSRHKRRKIIA